MSNTDMVSVFMDLWSRRRGARSLTIHTDKYIITNCISCFEGKARSVVQLNNKGTWPGPRSRAGLLWEKDKLNWGLKELARQKQRDNSKSIPGHGNYGYEALRWGWAWDIGGTEWRPVRQGHKEEGRRRRGGGIEEGQAVWGLEE